MHGARRSQKPFHEEFPSLASLFNRNHPKCGRPSCLLSNSNESLPTSTINGVSRDDVIAALQRLRGDGITPGPKRPVARGFQRDGRCRICNSVVCQERCLTEALVKVGHCCAEAGVRSGLALAETLALFDFDDRPLDGKYVEDDEIQHGRHAGGVMRAIDMRYWLRLMKNDNSHDAAAAARKTGANIDEREGKRQRKHLRDIGVARGGCCCYDRASDTTKSVGVKAPGNRESKQLLDKQETALILEAVSCRPLVREVEGGLRREANADSATHFVSVPALWDLLCKHNSTLREGDAQYKDEAKRIALETELRAQEVRLIQN